MLRNNKNFLRNNRFADSRTLAVGVIVFDLFQSHKNKPCFVDAGHPYFFSENLD